MRRRHFIASSSALVLAGAGRLHAAPIPTPAQSTGPFYPDRLPADHDNDLVRVDGASARALGVVTHLEGRVHDVAGAPIEGAWVEIWQCDANGRYHHPRDRRPVARDIGFQGYGRVRTADDGAYGFRTIRPVPYPGRTPHIHFAVTIPDGQTLITQMYVRGEPGNARDALFNRIPQPLRERVLVTLAPSPQSPQELVGRFDIVLAR